MPRVLLLETQNEERYRNHRAEGLPFLLGRLQARGMDGQWWTVQVPPPYMHAGHRYLVDLPPDRKDLLTQALREWRPDVIIQTDHHVPELRAALQAAAPAAVFIDRLDPTFEWLSLAEADALLDGATALPQPPDSPAVSVALVDAAQPCYQRRFLGAQADAPAPQSINLVRDRPCAYVRTVAENPYYAGLTGSVLRHRGCTFCLQNATLPRVSRTGLAPVERMLRQVEAHQLATPSAGGLHEYLFHDIRVALQLDKLAKGVVARGLQPCSFVTMLRADDLLATLPRLERALQILATGRHTLRLVSIGAENFSEAENGRMNKDVTPAQLWKCVDALEQLLRRYPGTFLPGDEGHLTGILFTPWTRPEDVLVNVEAARRLGWVWLERMIGTRLQLWPQAPITELAAHDGLIAPSFEDLGVIAPICIAAPEDRELAWRFADRRTALLHRILIRLDKVPFSAAIQPDEPLRCEIQALRAHLPDPRRDDRIQLVAEVVQSVAALGANATIPEVFDEIARAQLAAGVRAQPKPAPAPARPVGQWEVQAALAVLRAVALQHPDKLWGHQLVQHRLFEDQGEACAQLDFVHDHKPFGLLLRLRRPGAPFWLASQRFALAHADDTPPRGEIERRLGQLVLKAVELHVPQCCPASEAPPPDAAPTKRQ